MGTLKISAKCSDLCYTKYTSEDGSESISNSYVPKNIRIGGGDYIDLDIDMATGQILNWIPVTDSEVVEAQKES